MGVDLPVPLAVASDSSGRRTAYLLSFCSETTQSACPSCGSRRSGEWTEPRSCVQPVLFILIDLPISIRGLYPLSDENHNPTTAKALGRLFSHGSVHDLCNTLFGYPHPDCSITPAGRFVSGSQKFSYMDAATSSAFSCGIFIFGMPKA